MRQTDELLEWAETDLTDSRNHADTDMEAISDALRSIAASLLVIARSRRVE